MHPSVRGFRGLTLGLEQCRDPSRVAQVGNLRQGFRLRGSRTGAAGASDLFRRAATASTAVTGLFEALIALGEGMIRAFIAGMVPVPW